MYSVHINLDFPVEAVTNFDGKIRTLVLVGGIVGPGYSLSRYILGCSQRLAV